MAIRAVRAILTVAGLCGAAAAASQALAQPKPPAAPQPPPNAGMPLASIAVIDIQAVLRQSTAAQALQAQFKIEQDAFQAAIEKQQKELKALEDELERQRASSTPDVFAERRRKIQERVAQVNAALRDRRRALDEAFNAAMGQLQAALNTVIEEMAKSRGINMVLRKEAVLANLNAFDLTAPTLEEFNRRMPGLKATFPPRP